MPSITYYLIANPLIALGLGLLVLTCIYSVVRRQIRSAMGLWFLIIIVLFYIHVQLADEPQLPADGKELSVPELSE